MNRHLWLSALLLGTLHAQAATLSGRVTDSRGTPIEGAKITLEGSKKFAVTDVRGEYRIADVDDGHVHLHVFSSSHVHGDRTLDIDGESATADFQLRDSRIENVLVTASFFDASVLETHAPVSVLQGQALREREAPTLGDTVNGLPGVHSSGFGAVASSPVIRGTDGPRVKVVQNGLDVSDASRVGPDHNVASEVAAATQVEVLRGPATLQYGSGAIGGVVNVVDQRIPSERPSALSGELRLRGNSVADERFATGQVLVGRGDFAWYADAFTRRTEDYEIPGYALAEPHEEDVPGVLDNSGSDSEGFTLGGSFIGDQGYLGIAYQGLENRYGIAAHGEHAHEEEEMPGEEEGHEGEVSLDVDLRRTQLAGAWYSPLAGLVNVRYRAAHTDYEHVELEGDEVGTVFRNQGVEQRLSAQHEALAGWHGVLGLHQQKSDFEAQGEEAFTPSNTARHLAVYLVEEKRSEAITWQLGARYERADYQVHDAVSIELHHEEGAPEPEPLWLPDVDMSSLSLSAGSVWHYREGYSLGLSLTRAERAPSHQELFSSGLHVATRTFDVGLAFDISDPESVVLSEAIDEEVSSNLDLTWRKYSGRFDFALSLFHNRVHNYIYQRDTGLVVEAHHEEEEPLLSKARRLPGIGVEEPLPEEEGIPVFAFAQADATLYGAELETGFDLSERFSIAAFGDLVRARLDDQNLPRTPPLRLGADLRYGHGAWSAFVRGTWYDSQERVAPFETVSASYTLWDAGITYDLAWNSLVWTVALKGENLSDEEVRPHTSLVKDLLPQPGRNVALSVGLTF